MSRGDLHSAGAGFGALKGYQQVIAGQDDVICAWQDATNLSPEQLSAVVLHTGGKHFQLAFQL